MRRRWLLPSAAIYVNFCIISLAVAQVPLDALMRGGRIHYDAGRYDRAKEQFSKALGSYGANADTVRVHILIWLGLSEAWMGELDSARSCLAAAHALTPALTERLKTEKRWADLLAALGRNAADSLAAFDVAHSASEQVVRIPVQRNGLWGFADASGNIVIAPEYDAVREFHEGLAAVMLVKRVESPDTSYDFPLWGYINTDGDTVIGLQFREAGDFSGGLARAVTDRETTYIDRKASVFSSPAALTTLHPDTAALRLWLKENYPDEEALGGATVCMWRDWAAAYLHTSGQSGDLPVELLRWQNGCWNQVLWSTEGLWLQAVREHIPDLTPEGIKALGINE